MQNEKEIARVKKFVLEILEDQTRARNDDKFLTFKVLQKFLYQGGSGALAISLDDLPNLPTFETVTRCRARIQNVEGLFLPTNPEVRKRRKQRQSYFQHEFADTFGPFI